MIPRPLMESYLPLLTKQVGAENVDLLLEQSELVKVATGERFIVEGQPVDKLYLLLDGVARVSIDDNGGHLSLGTLHPGQWVGEVTLLAEQTAASSNVVAEADCVLLAIAHQTFRTLQAESSALVHAIVHTLMPVLSARIRGSNEVFEDARDKNDPRYAEIHVADTIKHRVRALLSHLAGTKAD